MKGVQRFTKETFWHFVCRWKRSSHGEILWTLFAKSEKLSFSSLRIRLTLSRQGLVRKEKLKARFRSFALEQWAELTGAGRANAEETANLSHGKMPGRDEVERPVKALTFVRA